MKAKDLFALSETENADYRLGRKGSAGPAINEGGHKAGCTCGWCKNKGSFGKKKKEGEESKEGKPAYCDACDRTKDKCICGKEASESLGMATAAYAAKVAGEPYVQNPYGTNPQTGLPYQHQELSTARFGRPAQLARADLEALRKYHPQHCPCTDCVSGVTAKKIRELQSALAQESARRQVDGESVREALGKKVTEAHPLSTGEKWWQGVQRSPKYQAAVQQRKTALKGFVPQYAGPEWDKEKARQAQGLPAPTKKEWVRGMVVRSKGGRGPQWGAESIPARIVQQMLEDDIPGGSPEGERHDTSGADPEELRMGIEVELKDHTDDPRVAEEIALDHLAENPKYYSILKQTGLAPELKGKGKGTSAKATFFPPGAGLAP